MALHILRRCPAGPSQVHTCKISSPVKVTALTCTQSPLTRRFRVRCRGGVQHQGLPQRPQAWSRWHRDLAPAVSMRSPEGQLPHSPGERGHSQCTSAKTVLPRERCRPPLRRHLRAEAGPSSGQAETQGETGKGQGQDQGQEVTSAEPDQEDGGVPSAVAVPSQYERLFSSVNQATLEHEPGSLTSAVLLVAGTTVGAGILAIPAVTQEPGFLASSVACVVCWLYMVTTGLLVAEVNVNTMCELGSGGVSLVSMAERTLGKVGVQVSCLTYVLIHYALLVAYVARSSDIIADASGLPTWASAGVFSLSLGSLCYFGSQRVVGAVNGALVVGVISSFLFLLAVASSGVSIEPLLRADFSAVPAAIPIIALSFVYQNVVPVVATNLEGDLPRIRTAIVFGTAIPLVMFLAWNAVILGSLPVGPAGSADVTELHLVDPLVRLQEAGGTVGSAVQVFSFFAITTSYIGFVLGLTDFLSDWLRLPVSKSQLLPHVLTILPPLGLALLNPDVFFRALDVAGTYGVLVLFGIIPAAMAWSERYSKSVAPPITEPLVPGERLTLLLVFSGAGIVITNEIINSFFS